MNDYEYIKYEMLNYHYFWTNEFKKTDYQDNKDIFDDIDYEVCQIILKYSYPNCMLQDLTDIEKYMIIYFEEAILTRKIESNSEKINKFYKVKNYPMSISLSKIPRILYDLFNLLYQLNNIQTIQLYRLETKYYDLYKNRLYRYHNNSINSIIELNNFINNYMEINRRFLNSSKETKLCLKENP